MTMYGPGDRERRAGSERDDGTEPYRSPWRRDHARLIHSPSFRRLQGKTQVFAGHEGDFFRNRLTHSLEVAQIAKSIAIRLNATSPHFSGDNALEPDLVEFAGLAHDLGHPPFGHNGEAALDAQMADYGGFEGNAQTLRILSRLEKKEVLNGGRQPFDSNGADLRAGLNVTYRSLASVLKYDHAIPQRKADRVSQDGVVKGFYEEDSDLVRRIKEAVLGIPEFGESVKTVECSIMDIADDIAYSTYDLEDVFKGGLLTPLSLFSLDNSIYQAVVDTANKRLAKQYPDADEDDALQVDEVRHILYFLLFDLFEIDEEQEKLLRSRSWTKEWKKMYFSTEVQNISGKIAKDGYFRTHYTSGLISQFLNGVEVIPHPRYPQLHKVRLQKHTFQLVEVLKNLTYEAVIQSPIMQVVEFRGEKIVSSIFTALMAKGGERLLPSDFREIYNHGTDMQRHRAVSDFIAGMTDRYALEFYSRLYGEQGLTMHKPL